MWKPGYFIRMLFGRSHYTYNIEGGGKVINTDQVEESLREWAIDHDDPISGLPVDEKNYFILRDGTLIRLGTYGHHVTTAEEALKKFKGKWRKYEHLEAVLKLGIIRAECQVGRGVNININILQPPTSDQMTAIESFIPPSMDDDVVIFYDIFSGDEKADGAAQGFADFKKIIKKFYRGRSAFGFIGKLFGRDANSKTLWLPKGDTTVKDVIHIMDEEGGNRSFFLLPDGSFDDVSWTHHEDIVFEILVKNGYRPSWEVWPKFASEHHIAMLTTYSDSGGLRHFSALTPRQKVVVAKLKRRVNIEVERIDPNVTRDDDLENDDGL